jgi:hypothetical protein
MNLHGLSAKQLRRAADLKEKIATLQNELESYLGIVVSSVSNLLSPKRKSRMSAAGRARIIAAQKARWAKVKAGKPATKAKGRRKMSAAARAKIAAAARARWAKAKASGKKAL